MRTPEEVHESGCCYIPTIATTGAYQAFTLEQIKAIQHEAFIAGFEQCKNVAKEECNKLVEVRQFYLVNYEKRKPYEIERAIDKLKPDLNNL